LIKETYKKFQCQACDFALWKIVAGRQFEAARSKSCWRTRKIGPLTGFRNKMGRPFSALIQLNAENAPEFDFGQGSAMATTASEEVDFSQSEALGRLPEVRRSVFEHGMAYVCEKSVGPAKSL
jgi:DNA topoisomerase-3